MAGTAARCPCGAIVQIPAAGPPQSGAASASALGQSAAPAVASLLDELTDRDWERLHPEEPREKEEPRPSDDEILAQYTKDYRGDSSKGKADRPIGVTILGFLLLLGGLISVPAAGMLIWEDDGLAEVLEALQISKGVFIASVVFLVVLQWVVGFGMLFGGVWGWWASAYWCACGVLRNLVTILNIAAIPDLTEAAPSAARFQIAKCIIRAVVSGLLFTYFLKGNVLDYFGVRLHPGLAAGIAFGAALATIIFFSMLALLF